MDGRLNPNDWERIMAISRRHGVTSVRVFGSFGRGEARPDSDLDLLIKLKVAAKPRRSSREA